MNRRAFLSCSLCTAGALLSSSLLKPSLSYATSTNDTNAPVRFLFFVFLQGGMDALTAYPSTAAAVQTKLRELRLPIAVPNADILPLARTVGLHRDFQALVDSLRSLDELKLFSGVGNPSGDRSHYNATSRLGRGCYSLSNADRRNSGWLARLMSEYAFQKGQVYSVGSTPAEFYLSQQSQVYEVPSLLESLRAKGSITDVYATEVVRNVIRSAAPGNDASVKTQMRNALKSMDAITAELGSHTTPQPTNPGWYQAADQDFLIRCSAAGELANYHVSSGRYPRTMISSTSLGSFDTHQSLNNILLGTSTAGGKIQALATGLGVLINRLKGISVAGGSTAWDKSAIVVFSEFGRQFRVTTGGDAADVGVDHGFATNYLMLSGAFRSGSARVIGNPLAVGDIENSFENAWVPTMNSFAPIAAVVRSAGYDPSLIFPQTLPADANFQLPNWSEQEPEGLFV